MNRMRLANSAPDVQPTSEGPRYRRALKVVVFTVLVVAASWFAFTVALGTWNPLYVVSSASMVPTLLVGDVIVVMNGNTFDTLAVGDIIVFNHPNLPSRVIVHRVHDIVSRGGDIGVITMGDNNPAPDGWLVTRSSYLGRVIFTVPRLGYLTTLLTPPINYVLIVLILALIFLSEARPTRKKDEAS